MQANHTNKIKLFHNMHYCFTCGYDVDRPGNACPVSDTDYHIPYIPHYNAPMYSNQGKIIVVQQKSLPYGTGAGMGWILANSIRKA